LVATSASGEISAIRRASFSVAACSWARGR
jgi:hypothetical protein